MFWFFRLAICVRALPYNGRMPQAKGDTQMTRTSYAMPAFDGTAALEQRPHLVLIRGGLSPRREHGRATGRGPPRPGRRPRRRARAAARPGGSTGNGLSRGV